MPFDDAVRDFVLACLARAQTLLTDLDRLDAAPHGRQQSQRVREAVRHELQAAEDVISAFVTRDLTH